MVLLHVRRGGFFIIEITPSCSTPHIFMGQELRKDLVSMAICIRYPRPGVEIVRLSTSDGAYMSNTCYKNIMSEDDPLVLDGRKGTYTTDDSSQRRP